MKNIKFLGLVLLISININAADLNNEDKFKLAKSYDISGKSYEAGELYVELMTEGYTKSFAPLGLLYVDGKIGSKNNCSKGLSLIFSGLAEKECNAYYAMSSLYKTGRCVNESKIDYIKSGKFSLKYLECVKKDRKY